MLARSRSASTTPVLAAKATTSPFRNVNGALGAMAWTWLMPPAASDIMFKYVRTQKTQLAVQPALGAATGSSSSSMNEPKGGTIVNAQTQAMCLHEVKCTYDSNDCCQSLIAGAQLVAMVFDYVPCSESCSESHTSIIGLCCIRTRNCEAAPGLSVSGGNPY